MHGGSLATNELEVVTIRHGFLIGLPFLDLRPNEQPSKSTVRSLNLSMNLFNASILQPVQNRGQSNETFPPEAMISLAKRKKCLTLSMIHFFSFLIYP